MKYIAMGLVATMMFTTGNFAIAKQGMNKSSDALGTSSVNTPPGLNDKTPHGLEKQGKTPEGWSKGKKKGWDKEHKHDHDHDDNNHSHD